MEALELIVDSIKFVIIIAFGGEDVEQVSWNWLLEDFNNWLFKLKTGELDNHEYLFSEGQRNLKKYITFVKKNQKTQRAKNKEKRKAERAIEPPWMINFVTGRNGVKKTKADIDKTSWNLDFLYQAHPLGKEPSFYEELYQAIQLRLKQKRKPKKRVDNIFDKYRQTESSV